MPSIHIRKFAGLFEVFTGKTRPDGYAVEAHNCWLRDGSLAGLPSPVLARNAAPGVATLHKVHDTGEFCGPLMDFGHCVSVIPMLTAGWCPSFDQVLIWHKDDQPRTPQRYFPKDDLYADLLVPQPTKAVQAVQQTVGSLQAHPYAGPDERSYTYTWVDQFGVESLPAPPSPPARSYDDDVWKLSNFDTPPANAAYIRIYRSSSAFESGENINNPMDTSYQLVEEVTLPLTGGTYVDDKRLSDLEYGTLFTHEEQLPPPLEQVIETEQGYLVGFRGNELLVSERFEAHNWPTRYRSVLPDRIVGLVPFGDIVFIATTGRPYRTNVSFVKSGDEADATVDPVPFEEHYPCISRFALSKATFGALYPTHHGLVALRAAGPAQLITRGIISEDRWPEFVPNIAAFHRGKYFAARSPAGRGFILDVNEDSEGVVQTSELVTFDWQPTAVHAGRNGRLYYADADGAIRTFGEDAAPQRYTWRSRTYRFPGKMSFTTAKVVGDFGEPIQFTLYGDGRVRYTREVKSSQPFGLPRMGRALEWSIKLEGKTRVHEVHVATSRTELTEE